MSLVTLSVVFSGAPNPRKRPRAASLSRPASLARTAAGRPVRFGSTEQVRGPRPRTPGHPAAACPAGPSQPSAVPATELKLGVWNHGRLRGRGCMVWAAAGWPGAGLLLPARRSTGPSRGATSRPRDREPDPIPPAWPGRPSEAALPAPAAKSGLGGPIWLVLAVKSGH